MFLQSLNVLKFLRKNQSPSPQIIYLSNLILIWELKDILLRIHIPNYPYVMKPHLKLLWNTETKLNVVYWIKLPQTDLCTEKNIDYQWSF